MCSSAGGGGGGGRDCFKCGEGGHMARDCPNPPKGRQTCTPYQLTQLHIVSMAVH